MSTILKEDVSLHAHALTNIVSLLNAYFSLQENVIGTKSLKLNNSQALEIVAKVAGKNTYKGLISQTRDNDTVQTHFKLEDSERALTNIFPVDDTYHKFLISLLQDYLWMVNGVLHPLKQEGLAFKMASAFAYSKISRWTEIADLFLVENFFNPLIQSDRERVRVWNLSMLFMANKLCLFVDQDETLLSFNKKIEEIPLSTIPYMKNAPKELIKGISIGSSVLDFHLFGYMGNEILIKRGVEYYIAAKQGYNKAIPLPNDFKTRFTQDDQHQHEMLESVYDYLLVNGYAEFDDPHVYQHPCMGNIPVYNYNRSTGERSPNPLALAMVKHSSHLSVCLDYDVTQSWKCINQRLPILAAAAWDFCIVNRHIAAMDYINLFFSHYVHNTRLNFRSIYINEAGLYKYDGTNMITFTHPNTDKIYTLTVNEFSLFLNCFLAVMLNVQEYGYYQTQIGSFMGLVAYQLGYGHCRFYGGTNDLKEAIDAL